MDFSITKSMGLSQSELAQAFGVTRVTINLWLNGRTKPHRLHTERVAATLRKLESAADKKLIPLTGTKRKPRQEELAKVLASL